MAIAPVLSQTDVTIQSATDGSVDYLQFSGNTLTGSALFNYGLGTDFKVVGSINPDVLVAQSQSTGLVDFLTLNANGSLKSSALGSMQVAPIVGGVGNALVSQGPSGIDVEAFNPSTGQLFESDLVPGTADLPKAVGASIPPFPGVGTIFDVVTQLANGEVDLVGINGAFGSFTLTGTDLLPQTIGLPSIGAVDQLPENELVTGTTTASLELIGTTNSSQPDVAYVNSGIGDPTHEGALVGTNLLNFAFPGWNVVDAANVAQTIFPGM